MKPESLYSISPHETEVIPKFHLEDVLEAGEDKVDMSDRLIADMANGKVPDIEAVLKLSLPNVERVLGEMHNYSEVYDAFAALWAAQYPDNQPTDGTV